MLTWWWVPSIASLLVDIYSPVFAVLGLDLASKTTTQIEDAFRNFKQDSLRDRMVTCFVGLCEYAGLIESSARPVSTPKPKTRTIQRSGVNRTLRQGVVSGTGAGVVTVDPPATPGAMKRTITLRSGGVVTLEVAVDLFGLDDADHRFVTDLIAKIKNYDGAQPALPAAPSNGVEGQPSGSKPADLQYVGGGLDQPHPRHPNRGTSWSTTAALDAAGDGSDPRVLRTFYRDL